MTPELPEPKPSNNCRPLDLPLVRVTARTRTILTMTCAENEIVRMSLGWVVGIWIRLPSAEVECSSIRPETSSHGFLRSDEVIHVCRPVLDLIRSVHRRPICSGRTTITSGHRSSIKTTMICLCNRVEDLVFLLLKRRCF